MRVLIFLLTLFLAVSSAWAAPAKLSERDRADVARLESYLNAMKSLTAGFTQINDGGEFRHGSLAIQRPGKMRVTYDPPQKDFLVADGDNLHMWDAEMQQQSSVPVGSSLADFILRDPVKLSGDVIVTKLARDAAAIELSLVAADDPANGTLTLVFEDKPLQLRQWRVMDGQGRLTEVSLEDVHEGVSFPEGTFHFLAPNFGKSAKTRQN